MNQCNWVMKGCGTPGGHAPDHLPDFSFFVCLCFLLPAGSGMLHWLSCAFLALCQPCELHAPIPHLRVLLRCQVWLVMISRNDEPFFLLPACLDLELELPWALFLGECSLHTTFLWHCQGKRGQPGALIKVPLHPLTWSRLRHWGRSHMWNLHVVMHADNEVEVCRIILDGIRAEWATWNACGLCPSLVSIRPEDWNMSKCIPHMQLLQ